MIVQRYIIVCFFPISWDLCPRLYLCRDNSALNKSNKQRTNKLSTNITEVNESIMLWHESPEIQQSREPVSSRKFDPILNVHEVGVSEIVPLLLVLVIGVGSERYRFSRMHSTEKVKPM